MTMKKRGLGRGLDALLAPKAAPAQDGDGADNTFATNDQTIQGLTYLPVDWLSKGKFQPRRDMNPNQLDELANSIRNQGIMQPIVVRPLGEQRYEVIAGERRWRAAKIAGLDKVPVIIRHVEDSDAVVLALIEAGADIGYRNKNGSTPLHIAAFFCYPEITQTLIEKGADKNVLDNEGGTALDGVLLPWNQAKSIYEAMNSIFTPLGAPLDYDRIKSTRPEIVDILQK